MEGDAGANSGCARWNPTKEQIDMLEGLYRSGIRTPTAEQIQQITTRLMAFGHIEGKNVFYWFQNHKARLRQKQKQDTISYLNRFLHYKTSVLIPPCPNVVCSPPFCVPYADIGLCHQQQQPKVLLPRTRPPPVPEKMVATTTTLPPCYDHHQEYNYQCMDMKKKGCNQQTLELFPLEPSGNLQARTSSSTSSTSNADLNYKCISNDDQQQGGGGNQLFF